MGTKQLLAIVLIAVGAILLYMGLTATDAPMEQLGKQLTGKYSDNTQMYIIGGAVSAVVGVALFLFGKK